MLQIVDKFDKFFLKTHLRLKIHSEVIDAVEMQDPQIFIEMVCRKIST